MAEAVNGVVLNKTVTSSKPMGESESFVKPMPQNSNAKPTTLIISLIVVLAGVASGFGLTQLKAATSPNVIAPQTMTAESLKVGDVVGAADADNYKDEVEGVVVKGGVEGEGSHHILRPGGPSQSVYLTSSVVDLNLFIDHKVKIWGETFAAQKAGWLMDVGRVEVVELNAPKPFEEKTEEKKSTLLDE